MAAGVLSDVSATLDAATSAYHWQQGTYPAGMPGCNHLIYRLTEEQIIGFLNEAEAGVAVKELCRKHGFSDAAFYGWRAKSGGLPVNEAKRLREIEPWNGKLKKLLAETQLDLEALKVAFEVKP